MENSKTIQEKLVNDGKSNPICYEISLLMGMKENFLDLGEELKEKISQLFPEIMKNNEEQKEKIRRCFPSPRSRFQRSRQQKNLTSRRNQHFRSSSLKTVPCKFFARDACKYGDNCRFLHEFRPSSKPYQYYRSEHEAFKHSRAATCPTSFSRQEEKSKNNWGRKNAPKLPVNTSLYNLSPKNNTHVPSKPPISPSRVTVQRFTVEEKTPEIKEKNHPVPNTMITIKQSNSLPSLFGGLNKKNDFVDPLSSKPEHVERVKYMINSTHDPEKQFKYFKNQIYAGDRTPMSSPVKQSEFYGKIEHGACNTIFNQNEYEKTGLPETLNDPISYQKKEICNLSSLSLNLNYTLSNANEKAHDQ